MVFVQKINMEKGSRVLFYHATLHVPMHTVRTISAWIYAHRKKNDKRPWQRATTCWKQTIMLLRWLYDDTDILTIARDSKVSQATAYRYIPEALTVVASKSPHLVDVLKHHHAHEVFLCLDGTLIRTNRVAHKNPETGSHLWYSGKHKTFGGNVQVLTDSTGYPLWVSPVTPGSTHDLTAAREHVLPVIEKLGIKDLEILADKGYTGAGEYIHTPFKGNDLTDDQHTANTINTALRAPAERANAMLKKFKALQKISLCPHKITTIIATALTVLHLNHNKPPIRKAQ